MTPDRTSGAIHAREHKRTLWGALWNYVLGPPFYWLDLLDNERRPSHSKIMWTVAFAFALALLVFATHALFNDGDTPTPTELAFLLGFAALTFALAGGLDGFKTWAKTRGGGTVTAFEKIGQEAEAAAHPGSAREAPADE